MLFNRQTPKQFTYRPTLYKPKGSKRRIEFRRLSRWDPHRRAGTPWFLLGLLLLVAAVLYILGGVKPPPKAPQLTTEDVAIVNPE